ncbi:MAG: tRNA (N(6)-L-threonylcarbamoyladenosine(37)-C(2))-methylthiotransferase MtaB [Actinobacteria bacterium]|nr:tRNA (N(6)-L-threonylcarbamoyladenosine(37)-C(2))-methylthiotransferase MtaB [Actinomycetota bacterium]
MMGKKITFSIHTLGCKVNQYEGERIATELGKFGWKKVDFSARADIYVVNSCTVTAVASHKSRQLIRRALRNNPYATVAVTGCYADSDREEIAAIVGVSLILGNGEKDELPRLLAEKVGELRLNEMAEETPIRASHTRSLIKIQAGCNQFCSYCIVPYVRGGPWSRPEAKIIDDVNRLVDAGTQEVVLTGIHLGLYGMGQKTDLGNLLAKLIEIPGLGRIRLSSIELREITPQIIELASTSGKICNHLHIPLQSGSNKILSRMNRHYTADEFIRHTDEFKHQIANLAITTDIIVGFPGETDNDFEDSVRLAEKVGFSKLHVFKFSPRKGTPAADFDQQVSREVKDKRSAALISIGEKLSSQFAAGYIGKELTVLIERRQGGYVSGVSDNYIRVLCEGPDEVVGKLITVKIIGQEETILYGRIKSGYPVTQCCSVVGADPVSAR